MNEIWKDVKNYKGYYKISNFGNIKSLKRYILNNGTKVLKKGKILKHSIGGFGYRQIALYKYNKGKKFYIHRLVISHFKNRSKQDVNHIDGNKNNNFLNNLEYCSKKDNYDHAVKNKLIQHDSKGRFLPNEKSMVQVHP